MKKSLEPLPVWRQRKKLLQARRERRRQAPPAERSQSRISCSVQRRTYRFDYNKSDKFVPHWEGPFKVIKKFDNGSYQLMDSSGTEHKTRVNGWRLNPYFSQTMEDPTEMAQVSLNIKEPLGEIAQDPFIAQHVPCISIMSLGPATRPCIDTVLCNPGTISDHFCH